MGASTCLEEKHFSLGGDGDGDKARVPVAISFTGHTEGQEGPGPRTGSPAPVPWLRVVLNPSLSPPRRPRAVTVAQADTEAAPAQAVPTSAQHA